MDRFNKLWYGVLLPLTLTAAPEPFTDPMKIIWGEDPFATTEHVSRYYGAGELFSILQTVILIVCICAVLVSLIALLFVNKAEMIADKKANIVHKLVIVLMVSSFASLLTIVAKFVEVVFYMR